MNRFWGAVRFAIKAYFGGCFGCLGVLTIMSLCLLVFSVTLGPKALSLLQSIKLPSIPFAQGISPTGNPSETPPSSQSDCYSTINAWVSKSEMGDPVTTISQTSGIFPVVTSPTDCGAVNAKLVDSKDQTVLEKTYSVVGGGRNGYGNYNPNKNLAPGSYKMEFWYGEILLNTIQLIIQ